MVGKEMSKSLSFLFVVLSSRLIRMFKVRCHPQPASMGVSGLSQPPNKAGISEVSKIKVRRASSVVSRMEKVYSVSMPQLSTEPPHPDTGFYVSWQSITVCDGQEKYYFLLHRRCSIRKGSDERTFIALEGLDAGRSVLLHLDRLVFRYPIDLDAIRVGGAFALVAKF